MKVVFPSDAIFASRQRAAHGDVGTAVVEEEVDDFGDARVTRVRNASSALVIKQLDVGVRLEMGNENNYITSPSIKLKKSDLYIMTQLTCKKYVRLRSIL